MTGQFLDEHDVGAVVQKAGAKSVAQQVGCEFLADAATQPQSPERLGHVISAETTRLLTGGGEQGRARVVTESQVPADPGRADRGEKDRPRFVALANNLSLARVRVDAVAIER